MKLPAGILLALALVPACSQPSFVELRQQMVAEIERDVRDTADYTGRATLAPAVIAAISEVPRHEFVPLQRRHLAYINQPLPIGEGQTISQPFIVALMTDLAQVNGDSRVLEVGTGSGYQAAVLAEIVDHVYTIEIVESLGQQATATLERLGYENVTTQLGDGYLGMPEFAPFDAIIVTAAPEEIPEPLIAQLRPGGRLVIPVGPVAAFQSLQVVQKDAADEISRTDTIPVRFVPFTRDE
ncbi:MAG: protein-L-isoaspartate(D-aspartate) O-methyltransferase [Gammaproteobacteria bacterium]